MRSPERERRLLWVEAREGKCEWGEAARRKRKEEVSVGRKAASRRRE